MYFIYQLTDDLNQFGIEEILIMLRRQIVEVFNKANAFKYD